MNLKELAPGSFIYMMPDALSEAFCTDMITRFERHEDEQQPGRIGQAGAERARIKQTTDLRITGKSHWEDVDKWLLESLSRGLSTISGLHPYFASNPFKDMGYHIQKYRAGDFYHWHVDAGPGLFSQRQLVALWYLNDVEGPGGETEFAFQNLKVKPRRGALLMFPPFWTHVHRAVALEAGTKYIATTWVCFS